MYEYTSPDGRVAYVMWIDNRQYGIYVYLSREDFLTCQLPSQTITLSGSPNATDMQAALPEWTYTGNEYLPPDPTPPQSVTAWQIRRWLIANGIPLEAVDSAIAAIPDATVRETAKVDWEWAPYVERSHPMLPMLAEALGITDIDAAFIAAEKITGTP